jgi:tetratricopeptide (TPR) repeat protein
MNRKIVMTLAVATGVLAMSLRIAPAEVLKKTDGKELAGVRIKWFEVRQEYQVEGADGSMIPVPAAEVDSLTITKPAEFDKAAQAMTARQYDAAIPILEDLAVRYKRLQWDARARELLANAYFAKTDFKKAAQVMGDLMENTPREQITTEQFGLYWTALMGAQMTAVLKKQLNEAIGGDSKTLAALAIVRRGDLNRADGKREDAVLDYLRAVLMYEEAREVHPEALFKAIQVLDEMRDPRADELKKKLLSLYPNSPFARKLGG